ncbi:Uncharacterised protein [Legionella beliardensis]|uniref:Uncharacterized protein n=1 Tax=Legionella beliardensis TaxID=91822 RepID=A0A378I2C0_9GAMM|nr:hypothetical protein [Legionella beliardensis]STX28880.1 Uncharacterised protein [Legionella beliardensis]
MKMLFNALFNSKDTLKSKALAILAQDRKDMMKPIINGKKNKKS